jgi:hypothetical protein
MLQIHQVQNFDAVDDPVKTEETIYNQLRANKDQIHTDYVYVAMPLAWYINHKGLNWTQAIINKICHELKERKLFFVCQHIQVKHLNFNGHAVFTPHATITDSYIPIPHYACSYDTSLSKRWEDRKYTFSFMGSFGTHPVRQKIYDAIKDREDCFVLDTGCWHFEGHPEQQIENKKRYIEILGDTKYSLCPRGTGPSTIRMWEAMAMGSCPVILSDLLKTPLKMWIEGKLWHRLPESFEHLELNLPSYDNSTYWKLFSNDNLIQSIVKYL